MGFFIFLFFMTISVDLRWRAIVLYSFMGMEKVDVAFLMGVHPSTIERWLSLFNKEGNVFPNFRRNIQARYPPEMYTFMREYINEHPTFYFEGLIFNIRIKSRAKGKVPPSN